MLSLSIQFSTICIIFSVHLFIIDGQGMFSCASRSLIIEPTFSFLHVIIGRPLYVKISLLIPSSWSHRHIIGLWSLYISQLLGFLIILWSRLQCAWPRQNLWLQLTLAAHFFKMPKARTIDSSVRSRSPLFRSYAASLRMGSPQSDTETTSIRNTGELR